MVGADDKEVGERGVLSRRNRLQEAEQHGESADKGEEPPVAPQRREPALMRTCTFHSVFVAKGDRLRQRLLLRHARAPVTARMESLQLVEVGYVLPSLLGGLGKADEIFVAG